MSKLWRAEDSRAARAEGWDVFDADEGVQIQKIDDPENVMVEMARDGYPTVVPELKSDEAAWKIVAAGVERRSPLHMRAFDLVSVAEAASMRAVCGGLPLRDIP